MDSAGVERWVERYEQLWRTSEADRIGELFSFEATYLPSPWGQPLTGLDEISEFWDAERASADEEFAMSSEVVAVDGDTAVVRVEVDYADPAAGRWRDLWVLRFGEDGLCAGFEEWPFAPGQSDGH